MQDDVCASQQPLIASERQGVDLSLQVEPRMQAGAAYLIGVPWRGMKRMRFSQAEQRLRTRGSSRCLSKSVHRGRWPARKTTTPLESSQRIPSTASSKSGCSLKTLWPTK
eukprot:scaffold172_cov254-Pinguiococcus_pyrenoidosus.AAC.18